MCNIAHDILICMLSDTTHACAIHLGLEREFKEICQNLGKFGELEKGISISSCGSTELTYGAAGPGLQDSLTGPGSSRVTDALP